MRSPYADARRVTATAVPPATAAPGASGARPRRRSRPGAVADYDFRRPIQLSREHARTLQLGFDGFARQATTVLTSALRTVCQVGLVSIEQRSYGEYVESLDATTYMTLFSIEPMPGFGVLELPLPATMTCVDHMLGGHGSGNQPVRPLSEIEASVIGGLVGRMLGEMRYAFAGTVEIEPVVTAVEYSPQFAQVAATTDVVVVTTFELRLGEVAHPVTVCLPFSPLLPQLQAAVAPAPVSDRERAQRADAAARLQAAFAHVPVDVTVAFRSSRLDPADLVDLAVGDVLRLQHPAAAPLEVTVENPDGRGVLAHATAGVRGRRLAALVVSLPSPLTTSAPEEHA